MGSYQQICKAMLGQRSSSSFSKALPDQSGAPFCRCALAGRAQTSKFRAWLDDTTDPDYIPCFAEVV
jgi:hypothetical protein